MAGGRRPEAAIVGGSWCSDHGRDGPRGPAQHAHRRRSVPASVPLRGGAILPPMDLVFAYLDPGSGSIIIQAVIAGIVALPILFRNRISAVVRTLRGGRAATPPPPSAPPTDDRPR